ncbi:MAG: hypothetical protein J5803_00455, partial [Desulfovibrio sp.]|nr:hypothetical protein [Desulfovibrio sp.]
MHESPFILFSWHAPFLPALQSFIKEKTSNHPENCVLLIPNSRPWRYIVDGYRTSGFHGLLPKVVTLDETIRAWFIHNNLTLFPHANVLDTIPLLYSVVRDLSLKAPSLKALSAEQGLQQFWPIGRCLAQLLDEIYRQGKTPKDTHLNEEGPAKAFVPLLQALGQIHEGFRQKLASHHLSTRSIDFWRAACEAESIPSFLQPKESHPVIIAGFSVLEGAEEKLLKRLWGKGCVIALHTDPALATKTQTPHHAVICHERWIERWNADVLLFDGENGTQAHEKRHNPGPTIRYYAGYDSHSELYGLRRDLSEAGTKTGSHAILLMNPSLLLPVLHYLPCKDVNIAIGYPFKRTLLGQLITIMLGLHERKEGESYSTRDLLHFLHHPFIQQCIMHCFKKVRESDSCGQRGTEEDTLKTEEKTVHKKGPYQSFKTLEESLLSGKSLQTVQALLEACDTNERTLLTTFFDLFITAFECVQTLADLATAFDKAMAFLRLHGVRFQTYPLEQEALARFLENIVPELGANAMQNEVIPFALQKTILEALLEDERIAFEADPLTGLQLLGLSETQLLHFE